MRIIRDFKEQQSPERFESGAADPATIDCMASPGSPGLRVSECVGAIKADKSM